MLRKLIKWKCFENYIVYMQLFRDNLKKKLGHFIAGNHFVVIRVTTYESNSEETRIQVYFTNAI